MQTTCSERYGCCSLRGGNHSKTKLQAPLVQAQRVFIAHSEWAFWRILHLRKGGVGENSFEFGFSQKVQENGALGNKSTPAISSAPPTPTLTHRDKKWTAMLLLVSHFHSSHKKQWENSLLPEGRLYLTTRKWSSQLSWKPSNSHCLQSLLPKI